MSNVALCICGLFPGSFDDFSVSVDYFQGSLMTSFWDQPCPPQEPELLEQPTAWLLLLLIVMATKESIVTILPGSGSHTPPAQLHARILPFWKETQSPDSSRHGNLRDSKELEQKKKKPTAESQALL